MTTSEQRPVVRIASLLCDWLEILEQQGHIIITAVAEVDAKVPARSIIELLDSKPPAATDAAQPADWRSFCATGEELG